MEAARRMEDQQNEAIKGLVTNFDQFMEELVALGRRGEARHPHETPTQEHPRPRTEAPRHVPLLIENTATPPIPIGEVKQLARQNKQNE